jgi:hypothetical protein
MTKKRETSPLTLLLVAAQCDEAFVVRCVCQMRQKGLEVALLGLYPGSVIGRHGVWLRPDQSLAEMEPADFEPPGLLILPGPQECTLQLLFNPRVPELIELTLQGGGWVTAVSPKIKELLVRSGLSAPEGEPGFLFQGRLSDGEFITQLVVQAQVLRESI